MSYVEPLVDIVILVHDQAAWADLCIRAVEHFTTNPYRLILVDMASVEEKTRVMLKGAEDRGHTVLRLAENRSFSHGVNAGAALGKGKFLILLNDDAIVTENWDAALIQDASPKHIGLVGARSNFAAGAQMDPNFVGEPPWLVFMCVCMRREVYDSVGPLDEITFDGFSTEDIDYSWRVKKAGHELKVSRGYVLHAGSRTLAAKGQVVYGPNGETTDARTQNDKKYNARLAEKWGKDWIREHGKMIGRVLVVTFHAEEWTRVKFMAAFAELKRSDGVTFSYHHMTRAPIHFARTVIADYALEHDFDWLVQLDDDAVFPPETIRRLLGHQKDVVTALAYQRKPPHAPCIYEIGDDGMLGKHMEGIEHTGLRKVDVSGFHVSAMRTSVIKRLRDAGIRQYYGGFENKFGEDFAMCLNLKRIGIQVYSDTDFIVGHIGESIVVDEGYKRAFVGGPPR